MKDEIFLVLRPLFKDKLLFGAVAAAGSLIGRLQMQIRLEDSSVCLFWSGRGHTPEGYPPPNTHNHTAIPPQDSPSGHSQLEPRWPRCHPVLAWAHQRILRAENNHTQEHFGVSLVSAESNYNQTGSFWGCRHCHPPKQAPVSTDQPCKRFILAAWPSFHLPGRPSCSFTHVFILLYFLLTAVES